MEENNNIQNNQYKGRVHFILSHSYVIFLLAVVFGVVFDIVVPLRMFRGLVSQYFGLILIVLGSLLAYWAQKSSHVTKKTKNESGNLVFMHGPYKYLRSPTHFGLFIMTLGLAVLISSPFSVLFTIIAEIITKIFFIKKEEKILSLKYGENYDNYKSQVKNRL